MVKRAVGQKQLQKQLDLRAPKCSVSSEYSDYIDFDFPSVKNQRIEEIYCCFRKPPLLTVIIGVKCSDGMVLIADRKVSTVSGRKLPLAQKIRGDLTHVLIGYAGRVSMFDILRKYIVGDVVIRRSKDPLYFRKFHRRIRSFCEAVQCVGV
ncbi:MAG: hypothetical protein WAM14_24030 [Candidatus Nitrosopolaris sp.]